jgi:uncharacterized SAM-binding protein YcdF (DUF218 family)
MFELKKIIGSMLMPLPLILIILFLILLFSNKTRKVLWSLSVLLVVSLWMISTPFFASFLVSPLEKYSVAFDEKKHQNVEFVVVLGCDVRPNRTLPANSQLGRCALTRLIEGLRIVNHYPNAKLVVSGAGVGKVTNSALMAKVAISLGIPHARIIQNPTALDTADEAQLLAPKLVDRKVALVTSASHMKRAQSLFKQQGVTVILAPTDIATLDGWPGHKQFIASAEVLRIVTEHAHEWVGLTWLSIVRAVDPELM